MTDIYKAVENLRSSADEYNNDAFNILFEEVERLRDQLNSRLPEDMELQKVRHQRDEARAEVERLKQVIRFERALWLFEEVDDDIRNCGKPTKRQCHNYACKEGDDE